MRGGDWLLVATLVVWLLVELVTSPAIAVQPTEGTLEQIFTDAMGGNVVHEATTSFLPEWWQGSWWSNEEASTRSSSTGALKAAPAGTHQAAARIADTTRASGGHSEGPLGRQAAPAIASHPRTQDLRVDSVTSMTLD